MFCFNFFKGFFFFSVMLWFCVLESLVVSSDVFLGSFFFLSFFFKQADDGNDVLNILHCPLFSTYAPHYAKVNDTEFTA